MTRMLPLVLALPATALGASYQVDASHTRAGFSVTHMMVSTVHGQFDDVSGTVAYDPDDLASTKIDVTIGVESVDTGNADRDAHLRKPDFFDVANHPSMTFVSKAVRDTEGPGFEIVGDLTLRGVTKEVVLTVDDLTDEIADPWGMLRRGAHATTTIDRQDFGVSYNSTLDQGGLMVGDEVTISLDVEIVRPRE